MKEAPMTFKVCNKCGESKPLFEFYKRKRSKDGHRYTCKACENEYSLKWGEANKEKRKEYHQKWRLANIETIKAKRQIWRAINSDEEKETNRKWYTENKDRKRESNRKWYMANTDRMKELNLKWNMVNEGKVKKYAREWYAANKEKRKEYSQEWRRENYEKTREYSRCASKKARSTPKGKLNNSISCRLRESFRYGQKAGKHWEELLGYTAHDLMKHLEKQFDSKMTWDNYGSYWHIDHIVPIAVFNFSTPKDIDFKKCWALENLQPLEAKANISKGARIERHFQPSLQMAI